MRKARLLLLSLLLVAAWPNAAAAEPTNVFRVYYRGNSVTDTIRYGEERSTLVAGTSPTKRGTISTSCSWKCGKTLLSSEIGSCWSPWDTSWPRWTRR